MLKRIAAFAMCLIMLLGVMPVCVSAAETAKDTLYLHGVLANSEVKAARIPNTTRNIVLFGLEDNNIKTLCYCLSSEEGDRLSRPSSIMDDYTWDLQPFLFTDETKSNNNIIITWTNSNKRYIKSVFDDFDKNVTPEEFAGTMRISVAVMDSETLSFSFEPYIFTPDDSDKACYYNSRVTKIGDKYLITWVVCRDIINDTRKYSIEGLYFDPDTNEFSSKDNKKDASGKPVPMVLVSGCNYIHAYSVGAPDGRISVLFEEATQVRVNVKDVIYNDLFRENYFFDTEIVKKKELRFATPGTGFVSSVVLADTYSSVVETGTNELAFYSEGNIYKITGFNSNGITPEKEKYADVSRTGDTRYEIISYGTTTYIAVRERTFLETDDTEILVNGKKYKKSPDGKWLDDENNEHDIRQEDVRLYYFDGSEFVLLPLKLRGENGLVFGMMPSLFIAKSGNMVASWLLGQLKNRDSDEHIFAFRQTEYEQQALQKADYMAVENAIAKADNLNQSDYKNFSTVTDAVNAVVYGKDYTEQAVVNGYADAIISAINALELRDADYTAVDSALEKVKALNKDEYKDFSAVESAVNAVVRGKKITEQQEVDKMAKAINDAIAGLEKKPVDSKGSGTGDTDGTGLWIAVMSVFAVLAGTAVIIKKRSLK